MSLMLLVGATLLVRSIIGLEHQRLGIRQDHLLKGHVYLPGVRYPEPWRDHALLRCSLLRESAQCPA